MSGIGWLTLTGSCLLALALGRAAHLDSVRHRHTLVDQTLDYERMKGEPHA